MFEIVNGHTHAHTHTRTPARLLSYKLTLWAFGSGELKKWTHQFFRCSRAANSIVSGPIWSKFKLMQILCMSTTIAHLSPMCQGQSAPKPYAAFPHPNDATHKIWWRLANWLQRYSNFRHSRVSNSKMSHLIRPKTELDRAFMPVLVTSNFDDDSIKNEQASIETPFSHYKSMGNFLDTQGQLTP